MRKFIGKRTDKSISPSDSKGSQGHKDSSHWCPYSRKIALNHQKFSSILSYLFMREWFWKWSLLKTVDLQRNAYSSISNWRELTIKFEGPRQSEQQLILPTVGRHSCVHLEVTQYPLWARFLFLTWFCTINLIPVLNSLNCIIISKIINSVNIWENFSDL